jgi:3',5'-cyclic AMP phosphodiesterase CpdA
MANDEITIDRRRTLECMLWAGTGVLWTVAGGVPASRLIGSALAADTSFSFVQISDSHIGFKAPANPDSLATLDEAIGKIGKLPARPDFMIHTGDIVHVAKPELYDTAAQSIAGAKLETHYAPGEHDITDPDTYKAYLDRFGKGAGGGWYSFDHNGVHFISLVNVVDLKDNGLGYLGADQLAWLADDLKAKTNSTPIVVFAHIPLWMISADWGWGTQDAQQALASLARFGSVTVLNGHIHQLMQKVEGNVTFHTARSTAFPQPAPGTAPAPGPMLVPAGQLRSVLGIAEVAYVPTPTRLAITDMSLAQ